MKETQMKPCETVEYAGNIYILISQDYLESLEDIVIKMRTFGTISEDRQEIPDTDD